MSSRKPFRKKKTKNSHRKAGYEYDHKRPYAMEEEVLDKIWSGQKNSLVNIVFAIQCTRKRVHPNGKKIIIKGEWKIKMVIENWPRNYIWLTGFMKKILFNKIWPNLLTFQLKHKQWVQTPLGAKGGVLMAVKCQGTCVLRGLLRWYSCWMVLKCVFICPQCLMLAHELVEVGYIGWLNLEVNT